jgi:hypothetical protein
MKKYIFSALLILSTALNADQTALTDKGEIVILKSNGMWSYKESTPKKKSVIPLNKKKFTKGKNAAFTLKSNVTNSQFSFDPKLWSFKKESESGHEYSFELRGEDLYGMAITEAISFPVENLSELALQNAQDADPNAEVIFKEYRIVNDYKVIYMEILGTIEGTNFIYKGYYFSNDSGSTQLVIYTTPNLAHKYVHEYSDFLNGFSVQ